jgi:hypothetical protein
MKNRLSSAVIIRNGRIGFMLLKKSFGFIFESAIDKNVNTAPITSPIGESPTKSIMRNISVIINLNLGSNL